VDVFEGFTQRRLTANGISINVTSGGAGPPLLLLHGYPQTYVMWHRVAPRLAEHFTVVCPDLRGYGDSAKPPSDSTHAVYAKRTMANDAVALMRELGYERFAVAGHDRGARVARRLALDHPQAVTRLALLDIVPTATIYETLDQRRATTVWRFFFLTQPPDLPERLIGSDPLYYLNQTLDEWAGRPDALTAEAHAEYERSFDAATVHASCEDYRAGATIDRVHDREDAERSITSPVLVLWSSSGIGATYDVLRIWQDEADDVRGRALDCGHFLAEERPDEVAHELLTFFAETA
jgi:haloacetate dehalogenase